MSVCHCREVSKDKALQVKHLKNVVMSSLFSVFCLVQIGDKDSLGCAEKTILTPEVSTVSNDCSSHFTDEKTET